MAAEKPIILEDAFNGKGTSVVDAYTYGSSKITISGTLGGGITANSLRVKITLGNGTVVPGMDKLTPKVVGNTFTFHDISLQPGLNIISFYQIIGSSEINHLQFYVNYNDTPIIEEITVEDTTLNPSGITYYSMPSSTRMVLNMNGKALNADNVIVENVSKGEVVQGSVSKTTGFFSLKLPVMFGENTLRFTAMNQNKTVGTIERKLVVVTTSVGEADLLYNLSINGDRLMPDSEDEVVNNTVRVKESGNTNLKIEATALLQYDKDNANRPFDSMSYVIKEEGASSETVYPINTPVSKPANDGFTEYTLVEDILAAFTPGKKYSVWLVYKYKESAEPDADTTSIDVRRYQYTFQAVDESAPQFISGTYLAAPLSTSRTNTLLGVPAELLITGDFIDQVSWYKIYLNEKQLHNSMYSIDVKEAKDANDVTIPDRYVATITLKSPDAGTGNLKINYENPDPDIGIMATVQYPIKWQVAPYVQLTYKSSNGADNSFYDGFQINSESDIPTKLNGRVYNFDLKAVTPAPNPPELENLRAELNGHKLKVDFTDTATGEFSISKAELTKEVGSTSILKKGTNTLKITLNPVAKPGATPVVFTYEILYITAKAPSIEEVKLWGIFNGKETELTQSSSGGSYETGAAFLSKFSFKVKDASKLYVEKNGKRIVDFVNDNGSWKSIDTGKEYQEALQELPGSLQEFFGSDSNIKRSGSSFEGAVSASKYNRMLDKAQQAAKGSGEQKNEEQERLLSLLPLTLKKNNTTIYTIVAEDESGTIVRYNIKINQKTNTWEILSPTKARPTDPYITVNSNSAYIKIFAEKADKVLFGKIEAKTSNRTDPDFEFDRDFAKAVPKTYYVFTATVPLKSGLNSVKYTIQVGDVTYNDQIQIFNANSTVDGAEYRDVLGKKVSFQAFNKGLELKFPTGTVLLSPSNNRAGEEVKNPTEDIFVDTPLYFGIADRTTGQVNISGNSMESRLVLDERFNYASPLYYIDAGDVKNPGGRDPYYDENDGREFRDRYDENLVPSREGTLSIQYDSSIVNAANNIMTVFYHNGFEWKNVGGVVNTGKKTITVPFRGFGYYMVMKNRESFEDVVFHDFARDAMETLYSKGIMPAYSYSTFGANRDMSRGEFATMLVKALDLPINAGPYYDNNETDPVQPTFLDVRPRPVHWDYDYKYIETAARAGIIRGKIPGYFRPDDPLTREEAAVMISRALNLKLGTPESSAQALNKMFTDGKDVSYYATASVLAVAKAKLMNGEPDDPSAKKPTFSFKPENNLTRAEMAVITIRVMTQLKKLPK
ncbi:S-layer homology domain-containing protein [Brevibacillus composti]|uniref:S-layer homology domain-containing protein n=1 Tax=Brevibacillus composti TaxID=2796470 RepID=A0A7T5EQ61_9BACL|nr:S-layer homology domain-containing protein [Brevibacillus composti]QUO43783.1 S-layer homology domain-containing protein [Brevibacillus composti]